MTDFTWIIGGIVALLVIAGVGFFAWRSSGFSAWLSTAMQTRRAMQDELAHDGVDEDDPVLKDIVDAARKDGAL